MTQAPETHSPVADAGAADPHSMYAMFQTDEVLEQKGVELDYGWGVITVARAGGGNKRFARVLEAKSKPYLRAIQTETMDPEIAGRILMETYAETIIIKWQTRVEGELKVGIDGGPGVAKLLPVNTANIVGTFTTLGELFRDVQAQANRVALFRDVLLENASGN